MSLSCGAILNLGFCRYAGKGQGEVSLLRRMWDIPRPGVVILGDSLMSNWTGIIMLKELGLKIVSPLSSATLLVMQSEADGAHCQDRFHRAATTVFPT